MHYIWKEWKENLRGKGLWLSLSIIVILTISILFRSSALSYDQGFYILLINLLDSLIYFIPILCLFIGAFSIFQEKEQKTLIMLLTKKDHYSSFFLKKSLALFIVVLVPLVTWFFLYLLLIKFNFQLDIKSYLLFVLAMVVMSLVFLQMGAAIGSFSRSRMQIIGYTIFVWFYFFFLHDFILLSFLPDVTHENVKLFSFIYFLNPLQAVRMFLETGMGVYSFGHMSRLMQAFMWTKPIIFLAGNLLIWLGISVGTAIVFNRKEGYE
ncbi:copper ABC transporter permease [Bacillus sp. AFS076308]|uniref:ABC transporter permease n=1 Tax=unclassified Bacillus (in: firmicutes) TaxID=185979 RepID=UPI000BF65301|nr:MULTISPECIES: ABC transporter permease subunit [unclassified Bacillus (in: firmicutes)]PFO07887.1 copper ABC transporter permease [Bacillus sp. AFS076308]PGV49534.1 copper ABC transporter permease [Bacillus sp. AFS037270]